MLNFLSNPRFARKNQKNMTFFRTYPFREVCHNRLEDWLVAKRDKVEVQLRFVATTLKPLQIKKNLQKI